MLLTDHNCWGFDDSASAIHDMLEGAISKVGEQIDTFAVGSLPDSYLRLLSAGGNWLETLSNLVLNKAGVEDQFSTLSVLLKSINTRLVFIIEDLDRNDTRVFDIQEVLRFLQMLKRFDNISFVLTGGINSNARIDFPKLCDRIEYLKTIDSEQIANVVSCLRNRCFDHTHFSFHTTGDDVETPWRHLHWTYGALSANPNPSQALGRILDTPRALRLTLERTSYDWDNLHGEIDWDHLLVINSLRNAAPEALSFLFRRWSHLCRTPTNTEKERQTHTTIRKMITEDWLTTESNADWDAKSVQALFRVILPPVDYWLDEAPPAMAVAYRVYTTKNTGGEQSMNRSIKTI